MKKSLKATKWPKPQKQDRLMTDSNLNNRYIIQVSSPLLRPGLKIKTEASERYVVQVVRTLMEKVREINETCKLGEADA